MTSEPGLVPELAVTNYEASRRFWCDLVGFCLRYERPEEGFGYLVLGNAHLMLDQINHGRTWATGPLEPPLGRGINLAVQVADLDAAGRRRGRRPMRPATRSGLRKIADASRESPSFRLTRAERGVVQHIARKYRVNASSVEQYMGYARQSGKTYNVDPYLIMAVMATESSFNPRAQSRVGAQGLMQVHTKMHKKRFKPYGSTDTVWEPKVNIQVGSSILSDYLKRYGGSERRALKAYVGAARMSHDGGYGNKVLRRRDEFVSVSVAASNNATSQAMASQADGGRKSVDL